MTAGHDDDPNGPPTGSSGIPGRECRTAMSISSMIAISMMEYLVGGKRAACAVPNS